MSWHLFSLVLASATGWALLAVGFLPVAVLRQARTEALKAVGAWALVAATAPPAVFHWYLIFALICLLAWTRLDRPAGKILLAISASLGLSLGIVFPLYAALDSLMRENPVALASLYLGGAVSGLAYALAVAARVPDSARQASGFARALLLTTIAWTALLVAAMRWIDFYPRTLMLPGFKSSSPTLLVNTWTPLAPALVLVVLAFFAGAATRRAALDQTRRLAGGAAVLALATNLLAQFVLR